MPTHLFANVSRAQCEAMINELADRTLSVAEVRNIKQDLGEDLANLVLSSAQHQSTARAKLGDGTWWFTHRALQQSTPWQVAKLKSSWFGDERVYDLCCGIGGDAVQLSQHRNVCLVDADPHIVMMAEANVVSRAKHDVEVVEADASEYAIPGGSELHIDPDRRAEDSRTSNPEFYSPAWPDVVAMLRQSTGAITKLAPAATIEPIDGLDTHRVWIALTGTVREQSLLYGTVLERFHDATGSDVSSQRSALIVQRDGNWTAFGGSSQDRCEVARSVGEIMVDPDAAIRAAGLTESFAVRHQLSTLGGPSGFLTGDQSALAALADTSISEQVVWSGSCDDRKLRRELRSRNMYPQRIKTRGVNQDPNKLEKRLRECGEQPVTLWIGRTKKSHYATITTPGIPARS